MVLNKNNLNTEVLNLKEEMKKYEKFFDYSRVPLYESKTISDKCEEKIFDLVMLNIKKCPGIICNSANQTDAIKDLVRDYETRRTALLASIGDDLLMDANNKFCCKNKRIGLKEEVLLEYLLNQNRALERVNLKYNDEQVKLKEIMFIPKENDNQDNFIENLEIIRNNSLMAANIVNKFGQYCLFKIESVKKINKKDFLLDFLNHYSPINKDFVEIKLSLFNARMTIYIESNLFNLSKFSEKYFKENKMDYMFSGFITKERINYGSFGSRGRDVIIELLVSDNFSIIPIDKKYCIPVDSNLECEMIFNISQINKLKEYDDELLIYKISRVSLEKEKYFSKFEPDFIITTPTMESQNKYVICEVYGFKDERYIERMKNKNKNYIQNVKKGKYYYLPWFANIEGLSMFPIESLIKISKLEYGECDSLKNANQLNYIEQINNKEYCDFNRTTFNKLEALYYEHYADICCKWSETEEDFNTYKIINKNL